jgi:hypothetical protein
LGAVIDLGPALVDTPKRIAAIAEQAREGNGALILEYAQDLERAFAIPILRVAEFPGVSVSLPPAARVCPAEPVPGHAHRLRKDGRGSSADLLQRMKEPTVALRASTLGDALGIWQGFLAAPAPDLGWHVRIFHDRDYFWCCDLLDAVSGV